MDRTTRIVASFAFGATLVVTGLMLGVYSGDAARVWTDIMGSRFREKPFSDAANTLLLGGLIIEGLALHGWIISRSC